RRARGAALLSAGDRAAAAAPGARPALALPCLDYPRQRRAASALAWRGPMARAGRWRSRTPHGARLPSAAAGRCGHHRLGHSGDPPGAYRRGLPRQMSVALLETLEDVDDAGGYARWRESVSRVPRG